MNGKPAPGSLLVIVPAYNEAGAIARVVHEVGTFWPYGIALIHAYRGERDQAFDWLEKAHAGRDVDLMFLKADPLLMPLHNDPRWSALMKKMNLPE